MSKKAYQHQWYASPIDIPPRREGKMEIRHRVIPKGEEVLIVGSRQALLRGIRPARGITKQPLIIHELVEHRNGHVAMWMTDLPEELNQIGEMLYNVQPQGRVLVGGLGLGILTSMVAQREDVTDVTVVERSKDVIKLCWWPNSAHATLRVAHSDIYKYLRTTKEEFDYYLLDTWQGTNEGTWWEEVMPLRRIIRQRWGHAPEIHCWAEDIMWGQIYRALRSEHSTPHWYYTYIPRPMSHDEALAFLNMVGTQWWEKKYGPLVDRYVNEMKRTMRRTKAS